MLTALIIVTLLYLFAIGSLIFGFDRVGEFQIGDEKPIHKFSIIIPFRNEAEKLPILLDSISKLEYPNSHSEYIFIDDDSSDNSFELIANYFKSKPIKYKLFKNKIKSGSPKKDAISIGIKNASFNWIITTDADCKLPPYWLDAINSYVINSDSEMIVAPVIFRNQATILDRFQVLDMLSLQGATIGGFGINRPFLCNGANLAYSKDFFKQLKGFEGNDKIASGDDMFLLHKAVKNFPDKVNYLRSQHSIVETSTQPNFNFLVHQRVRWASKSKRYNLMFSKVLALIVFVMNASIIVAIVAAALGILRTKILLYIFVIKASLDFLLIFKSARFLDKESVLLSYPITSIIYPFFVVIIGVMSSFGAYKWKGRSHRD